MVARLSRVLLAMLLPFLLTGCLLAPGKFVSRLSVSADRSFTFSYVGEVIALDMSKEMGKGLGKDLLGDSTDDDDATPSGFGEGEAVLQQIGLIAGKGSAADAEKTVESEAKNKAIAEALSKEAGYRKVTYQGDGKFLIDYAISGTLDHAFIWPFNIDAEIVFPFIAVELRGNGTVRVNAPAFANDGTRSAPGADQVSSKLDGVFTLDTDAAIVSQNSEDGVVATGGRKVVTWKATPLSKTAPLAVLRINAAK